MFLKRKLAILLAPFLLLLAVPAAASANTATPAQKISLGEAVKMATDSSITLAQDRLAVQMDQNSATSAAQSYASAGGAHSASVFGNSVQAAAYNGMLSADITLQNADLTQAADQKSVVYSTEQAYFAVEDAVYGEQVAVAAMQVDQEACFLAQVEQLQGTGTKAGVSRAESALEAARSEVTEAQTGVGTAYVKFDQAVGLDPAARPDLTSTATYDPKYISGLSDAQEAVAKSLQNNASVRIARNTYNLAVQEETTYQGTLSNASLSVQNAQLAYQRAVQTCAASTTAAFLNAGCDQNSYDAAAKAQAVAQAAYNDDRASYAAGTLTRYQLDSAAEGLMSAGQSLQAALHRLVVDRAELALVTGMGSVNVPVRDG